MSIKSDFTIVLPVYNGGEYLKECINSILAQTYPHFILQVYNSFDNTDGSTEYLNSLKDERIMILQATQPLTIEENWARFATNLNTEYSTIIGQDDLLYPNFLMEFKNAIEEFPDASLWHSHYDFIDSTGRHIKDCKKMPSSESINDYFKHILSMSQDTIGTGYVFRSLDYKKIGGIPMYQDLLFADFALWIELTSIKYKRNIGQNLFSFRIHQSTTTKASPYKYFKGLNSFLIFVNNQINKGNEELNKIIFNDIHVFLKYYAELLSIKIIKYKESHQITVAEVIKSIEVFYIKISPKHALKFSIKTKAALLIEKKYIFNLMYKIFKRIFV